VSGKPIILDANLLVLLVLGAASIRHIGTHKRLKAYTRSDFYLLRNIVLAAPKVLTLPNILTETSNLIRGLSGPADDQAFQIFGGIIETLHEEYTASSIAAKRQEFRRLGLTDCAILIALNNSRTLLTADHNLYEAALRHRLDAENFNHLRAGL
jgi:hypothetical protein